MSLFAKLRALFGSKPAAPADAEKRSRIARQLLADMLGLPVGSSYDTAQFEDALNVSGWLFGCVYRLAGAVGGIRPKVVRTGTDEEVEGSKANKVRKLLRRVNPEDTYRDFIEQNIVHLMLSGEGYIEKARNRLGDTAELWSWRPADVSPIADTTGRRRVASYVVRPGAGRDALTISADDMIVVRVYSPSNPLRGQSSVAPIWNDLLGDREAAKYNKRLLQRGMRTGGIMQPTEGDIGDDELRALRASIEAIHAGAENAGRPLVLPYGIEWKDDTKSPKDMDFLGMRKFAREIAAGVVGVPPVVIGNFDAASYANTDAQLKAFWDYSGRAILEKIFGALNEHWVHTEIGEEISIEPDLAQIEALVDNLKSRVENATKLVSGGIATINEARRRVGLKPIPDGDKLLVPVNLTPMAPDKVEPPPKPDPVAPPAAGADDKPEDAGDDQEDDQAKPPEKRGKAGVDREAAREAHEVALTRAERGVVAAAKVYLAEARGRFVARLSTHGSDPEMVGGNREAEAREAAKALVPALLEVVRDAGDLTLRRLGTGIGTQKAEGPSLPDLVAVLEAFDLANPRVLEYIETTFLVHLDGIADNTVVAVRDALRAGLANGEGIPELVARLEALAVFGGDRAERIARTETIGAYNLGSQEAFRAARVARKSWLTARDERVRSSHADADRETSGSPIDMGAAFVLREPGRGEAQLMYPGDPRGPAWAVVNCRCALLPEDEAQLATWIEHCKNEVAKERVAC